MQYAVALKVTAMCFLWQAQALLAARIASGARIARPPVSLSETSGANQAPTVIISFDLSNFNYTDLVQGCSPPGVVLTQLSSSRTSDPWIVDGAPLFKGGIGPAQAHILRLRTGPTPATYRFRGAQHRQPPLRVEDAPLYFGEPEDAPFVVAEPGSALTGAPFSFGEPGPAFAIEDEPHFFGESGPAFSAGDAAPAFGEPAPAVVAWVVPELSWAGLEPLRIIAQPSVIVSAQPSVIVFHAREDSSTADPSEDAGNAVEALRDALAGFASSDGETAPPNETAAENTTAGPEANATDGDTTAAPGENASSDDSTAPPNETAAENATAAPSANAPDGGPCDRDFIATLIKIVVGTITGSTESGIQVVVQLGAAAATHVEVWITSSTFQTAQAIKDASQGGFPLMNEAIKNATGMDAVIDNVAIQALDVAVGMTL